MSNFDVMKLTVEASMPSNTVLYDDKGLPSTMVRIPKFQISDVIPGGSNATHPAFIVNGVEVPEIFISKFQNIVMDDRAYSIAMQDPQTYVTFDQAKTYCENKGKGWHLMSNAEWAALELMAYKNNIHPRGNNYYGMDHTYTHEKGVVTYTYTDSSKGAGTAGRNATGSGPVSWSHDGTNAGIFDLNGNVWERNCGLRTMDGEIQIIPDNNSAAGVDESASSALWRAIMPDGSLVAPGTSGTLKIDSKATGTSSTTSNNLGAMVLNTKVSKPHYTGASTNNNYDYGYNTKQTFAAADGVNVPEILKVLGIYPIGTDLDGDGLWCRNYGERLPSRGGCWHNGSQAGVFALHLSNPRSLSLHYCGFRSAYVAL